MTKESAEMEFFEKRSDPRAAFDKRASCIALPERGVRNATSFKAEKIKNISCGGICLSMKERLDEGLVVKLKILEKDGQTLMQAFCEVKWCNKKEEMMHEAGMSFIALKTQDAECIRAHVEKYNKIPRSKLRGILIR